MFVFCISANHENSVFDSALCGVIPPANPHSEQLLAEILRILRPAGKLILSESGEAEPILAKLKLSGFLNSQKVSRAKGQCWSQKECCCFKLADVNGLAVESEFLIEGHNSG